MYLGLERMQVEAGEEDVPAHNVKLFMEQMADCCARTQQKLQGRRQS